MSGYNIKELAAILLFAVILFVLTLWLARRRNPRIDRAYFMSKWHHVGELCQESEIHWTVAVIEADKLLDEALRKLGYSGKTTGERLASATRQLSNPDGVWLAHKLRNRVVHEQNVKLGKKQLSAAMRGYRRALRDLGVL